MKVSVEQHAACQAEGGAERASPPGDLQVGRGGDEHDQDSEAEREHHQEHVARVGEPEELRRKDRLVLRVGEGACVRVRVR